MYTCKRLLSHKNTENIKILIKINYTLTAVNLFNLKVLLKYYLRGR